MTNKARTLDMSQKAIAQRLEEMRGLCDLMSYLARFRPSLRAIEATEAASKRDREGK